MDRKTVELPQNSRLIIVSNRVPYNPFKTRGDVKYRLGTGGLVTALDPVLKSTGGLWIGWDGVAETWSGKRPSELFVGHDKDNVGYHLHLINLTPMEVMQFYRGFANRILWPLFHSFITKATFHPDYWPRYVQVNRKFADKILQLATKDDYIWVHDYQLMLVPKLLKEANPELKVGFFLHIPFPPFEIYQALPQARLVVEGVLGADIIGFQVKDYLSNFLVAVERLTDMRVSRDPELIWTGDREIICNDYAISIDFRGFDSLARSTPVARLLKKHRVDTGGRKVILGVDRVDYTKGIKERLLGFARFLEKYPGYRGKVQFIQVTVPSRTRVEEYRMMKREIDEIIGRINGKYSDSYWIPIRYFFRSIPRELLISLYRLADVAVVTSLRDGMNLVAKEYVACRIDEDGVLVLSKFAGASYELRDALLINPYCLDEVAASLNLAFRMRKREKQARMKKMRQIILERDVNYWLNRFVTNWVMSYRRS